MDFSDLENFHALKKKYVARRKDDVSKLKNHIESNNFSEIRDMAHQCKGHSEMFQAFELHQIAESLSFFANKRDIEGLKKTFIQFKLEIDKLSNKYLDPALNNEKGHIA